MEKLQKNSKMYKTLVVVMGCETVHNSFGMCLILILCVNFSYFIFNGLIVFVKVFVTEFLLKC